MNKVSVFRALSAVFATKLLVLARWVLFGSALILFLIVWALATYVDPLWWLLLVIFIPLLLLGLVVYLAARFIAGRLYSKKLTKQQKVALNGFTDKTLRILEARSIPPFLIAGIVIKDLIVHRNLKSLKSLLEDTTTLRADFAKLEQEFKDET